MESDRDADLFRSASLSNMVAHLAGPLSDGARQTTLQLAATGRADITFAPRRPAVFIALKRNLTDSPATVSVVVGSLPAVTLAFAAYTETGAMLLAGLPPVNATTQASATFRVTVSSPSGTTLPAPLTDLFEVRVVEGHLGKLLYILGAEKMRVRRVAMELAAARRAGAARAEALDRLGAELGVPRFQANLTWDAAAQQLVATTERETDAAYRQRLAIFRPFVMATQQRALHALNGPAGAATPRGLMAKTGYAGRVVLRESDTDLAIGIRLVSPPNDARRLAYLKYLRDVFLLPLTASELPANRLLPPGQRQRARELLARVQQSATFPANACLAPGLAAALDRFLRVRAALGMTTKLPLVRTQDDAGGSRYELGLGMDIAALPPAELDQMAEKAAQRVFSGAVDPETQAILDALTPRSAAEDSVGRWLLAPCGLRTVHPLAGGAIYLSHFPVHGVVVGVTPSAEMLNLEARLHAPLDPGPDAALLGALSDAGAARGAATPPIPAWANLSEAERLAVWQAAQLPPAPLVTLLEALDLPTPTVASILTDAIARLIALPRELVATLRLDSALSSGLVAGAPAAQATLARVLDILDAAQISSVLPLFSGGTVSLVVATTALPGNARNLDNRRTSFRWFALAVEADPRVGTVGSSGSRNQFRYTGPGSASQVAAVLAVTPARRGRSDPRGRIDPYNVQVDVGPTDPLLSFGQYEYLMNLLHRLHPIGVTFDTRLIREAHVDLSQSGAATPLSQRLQKTFRPFRARRAVGDRRYTVED